MTKVMRKRSKTSNDVKKEIKKLIGELKKYLLKMNYIINKIVQQPNI